MITDPQWPLGVLDSLRQLNYFDIDRGLTFVLRTQCAKHIAMMMKRAEVPIFRDSMRSFPEIVIRMEWEIFDENRAFYELFLKKIADANAIKWVEITGHPGACIYTPPHTQQKV